MPLSRSTRPRLTKLATTGSIAPRVRRGSLEAAAAALAGYGRQGKKGNVGKLGQQKFTLRVFDTESSDDDDDDEGRGRASEDVHEVEDADEDDVVDDVAPNARNRAEFSDGNDSDASFLERGRAQRVDDDGGDNHSRGSENATDDEDGGNDADDNGARYPSRTRRRAAFYAAFPPVSDKTMGKGTRSGLSGTVGAKSQPTSKSKARPKTNAISKSKSKPTAPARSGRRGLGMPMTPVDLTNVSRDSTSDLSPVEGDPIQARPVATERVPRTRRTRHPPLPQTRRGRSAALALSDGDESDDISRAIKVHIRRTTANAVYKRKPLAKFPRGASRAKSRRRRAAEKETEEEEEAMASDGGSGREGDSGRSEEEADRPAFVSDSEEDDDDDGEDSEPTPPRRKGLRPALSRAKRTPARKKKHLPSPPPSPPSEELTKEDRQSRLDELVNQSAEISRQLYAAIDQNRVAKPEAIQNRRQSQVASDAEDTESLNLPLVAGRSLQPHQIDGVKWFLKLDDSGHNGILADSMGTGKTLQTVSGYFPLVEVWRTVCFVLGNPCATTNFVFSFVRSSILLQLSFLASIISNDKRGPHLVIAPLAVVQHWFDEGRDWYPSLNIFVHSGACTERLERLEAAVKADDFDIIVTSYELAMRDLFDGAGKSSSWSLAGSFRSALRKFKRITFEYVVLDEAHRLKNPEAKMTTALRKYQNARRRILLTGTPLSNNLTELWALLNVLNPRIFGNVEVFKSWFASPFDDEKGETLSNSEKALIVARMHTVLRPFFLRRLREDVCPDLAPVDELIVPCPSTPLQTALQTYLRRTRYSNEATKLRNVAMEMRKASNCAWLVSGALFHEIDSMQVDSLAASSGKLMWLHYALPRLLAARHRVLIFSQFVIVLDYISDLLDLLDIKYGRLDGVTKVEDRSADIGEFNSPGSKTGVFLLSTRAGGCGINMQSADTGM
jgi:hypothetical protein